MTNFIQWEDGKNGKKLTCSHPAIQMAFFSGSLGLDSNNEIRIHLILLYNQGMSPDNTPWKKFEKIGPLEYISGDIPQAEEFLQSLNIKP